MITHCLYPDPSSLEVVGGRQFKTPSASCPLTSVDRNGVGEGQGKAVSTGMGRARPELGDSLRPQSVVHSAADPQQANHMTSVKVQHSGKRDRDTKHDLAGKFSPL